jgi:hypothetical protein
MVIGLKCAGPDPDNVNHMSFPRFTWEYPRFKWGR